MKSALFSPRHGLIIDPAPGSMLSLMHMGQERPLFQRHVLFFHAVHFTARVLHRFMTRNGRPMIFIYS